MRHSCSVNACRVRGAHYALSLVLSFSSSAQTAPNLTVNQVRGVMCVSYIDVFLRSMNTLVVNTCNPFSRHCPHIRSMAAECFCGHQRVRVILWALLLACSTSADAFLFLAATKRPLSPFQACALHIRRDRPLRAMPAEACTLARAEALMLWLDENGAMLDGMSIEASPLHGLGAIATRSLEVGHAALLVPRHAQLLADSDALHTISGQLAERAAKLLCSSASPTVSAKFEESSLAVALLSEVSLVHGNSSKCKAEGHANTPSHFAAYLESLPSMADMPRAAWLWEDDRLETEVSAELAADARALRLQVGNEYLALAEAGVTVLASGETMSEEQWVWGRAIVMSRAVDVLSGLALVPGIDCVNHSEEALFEIFVDDEVLVSASSPRLLEL